jgi:hypothetical protein
LVNGLPPRSRSLRVVQRLLVQRRRSSSWTTCWAYWQDYDRHHLTHCDEVWVLMLSGWKESAGVQAEIRLARELRKPMCYVEPEELIYGTAPVATGTE